MANMYRSNKAGASILPTGDATAADVLTGKTFSNGSGVGIAGAMVNNGAVSGTATPSTPYTIPEGYHNGQGEVTAAETFPSAENYEYVGNATVPQGTATQFTLSTANVKTILIAAYTYKTRYNVNGDNLTTADATNLISATKNGTTLTVTQNVNNGIPVSIFYLPE